MPIYEYRRPDGSTFEVLQSFSDDPLTRDPETGVEVQRVLHAPAVHFKGSGFYNTDYGTKRRQRESASTSDSSSSADGGSAASSSEKAASTGSSDGASAKKSESGAKADSKPKSQPAAA